MEKQVICQNCKQEFTIEPDDQVFYQKIDVPEPTWCSECRLQRRLTFRNDRKLYKRTCDKTGEPMISIYSEDKPHTVYSVPAWWGDDWNPLDYGMDYDFSRPFFEQYKELLEKTPMIGLFVVDHSRMLNSPYNNMVLDLKNCYLLSNADFNEDCAYGSEIEKSKWCVDTNLVHESELCYEVINCKKCYKVFFLEDCEDCHNVWFSKTVLGALIASGV